MHFFEQLEIINPFKLWFIVALITGIDIFGHVLAKISGKKKGIVMTSAVGGFVSSTATVLSLAHKSKTENNINELVTAAMVANLTSFFQIFVLVASLNSRWLVSITPVLLVIIVSTVLVSLYLHLIDRKKMTVISENLEGSFCYTDEKEIFSIKHALKFALLLILVRIFTKSALILYGQSAFLATSILASFSGIDAVVINLAELADSVIPTNVALLTLLFVNASNLLSKVVFSAAQAKREFTLRLFGASLIVIVSSFVGYYFL
jgi:uncharacterized membrane protein (DUF4010 family)